MTIDCSDSPDIYYILVDGYGRGDVLGDLYSLDNTQFLDDLAQQGFYVANQSHTNYIQSIYSISSALNFTFIDPPKNEVTSWRYFTQLMALALGLGEEICRFDLHYIDPRPLLIEKGIIEEGEENNGK